jgi:Glycosyl transferase family 2
MNTPTGRLLPRLLRARRNPTDSTTQVETDMQREANQIPEEVSTYLTEVPGGERVVINNHHSPLRLGQFRAIGSLVMGDGWSGLEPWGVWSDGDVAILYIKNVLQSEDPGLAESVGYVIFEARSAVSEKQPKLTMCFQLGSFCTEFLFSWPDAAHAMVKVPVPTELMLAPVLRVEIRINGQKTPYELTEGGILDRRRVGIGIASVEVRAHAEDQAASGYARRSGAVESKERRHPKIEPIKGGKANVIAMTMVYNEGDALERWLRHYGRHVGERNLLVIDDGSDDGSTEDIGLAGRVSVPRRLADDGERADFVSDLQRALLRYYDAVIYTDCDEFLVPDPRRFANLREYVDQTTAECVRPVAFNIIHIRDKESEIDKDRPILDQRAYCQFFTPECKPSLAKAPTRYQAGFHNSDKKVLLDPELLLVHSKLADFSAALARLALTRNLRWSDRAIRAGWGNHSRAEDNILIGSFDTAERFLRDGHAIECLDPENLAKEVNAQMDDGGPPYRCQPFTGPLSMVPDWLRGTV